MASIVKEKNGNKRLSFTDQSGKRQQIRLGKMSMRSTREVKSRVEDLVGAMIAGHVPSLQTAQWIERLRSEGSQLATKLVNKGLIRSEYRPDIPDTLGAFITHYISDRTDVKDGTRITYQQVFNRLVGYFGEDRRLSDITAGEAKQWRRSLLERGLAEATVNRSCSTARQFFNEAIDLKAISSNPFVGLPVVMRGNPSRYYFVDLETITRVIDACPSAEWRLLVGLARYGGLRIPSEVVPLRWGDIDWDKEAITITSPKTEHHEGKGSRLVPIFPELRPLLSEAFDLAGEGTEFIIQRYRKPTQNLRTQFQKIIRRAGVDPWPKLWQNLRSSRETELVEEFPIQVITAWLGNTTKVAMQHYLQVTDEHWRRATSSSSEVIQGGAKCAPVLGCTGANRDAQRFVHNSVTVDSASRNTHLHEQVGAKGWARQDSNL